MSPQTMPAMGRLLGRAVWPWWAPPPACRRSASTRWFVVDDEARRRIATLRALTHAISGSHECARRALCERIHVLLSDSLSERLDRPSRRAQRQLHTVDSRPRVCMRMRMLHAHALEQAGDAAHSLFNCMQ